MPANLTAHSYGKSGIRLTQVRRTPQRHELTEIDVAIELTGDFAATYLAGDNASVIATDTMKNTVYALAAQRPVDPIESFGQAVARHFLDRNAHVASAAVELKETAWARLSVAGQQHPHAFTGAGGHRRTAHVRATRAGVRTAAGIEGLLLLKTTDSAFRGFLRDELTTLKETDDRIFATRLTAQWSYDDEAQPDYDEAFTVILARILETFATHKSLSVQQTLHAMGQAALEACPAAATIDLEMPNEHRIPVDLTPFALENRNELFIPTREPYGLIKATLSRPHRQ